MAGSRLGYPEGVVPLRPALPDYSVAEIAEAATGEWPITAVFLPLRPNAVPEPLSTHTSTVRASRSQQQRTTDAKERLGLA